MAPPYRSPILDHLGLVAGMFDERGIGEGIDQATQQNPARRIVTAGHAVNAMVLNGRGLVHQPRSLGPRFFQKKPPSRLFTPAGIDATHLNDAARGRALATLDDDGVPALYRLVAATAAARLGLAPTVAPLDRTSCPVDGRDNHDHAPDDQVGPSTRGSRRDHRPELNHVMLALIVEHHAGMPVLRPPLRGHSRDAQGFGPVVREPSEQLHTTDGTPDVVADRALDRAEHRQQLAHPQRKWRTRVPATVRAAQAGLAQAEPQARMPLTPGYRSHVLTATDGGIAPRWVLSYAASRQPQAKRTLAKPRRKQRAQELKAFKTRCAQAGACEAAARQALAPLEHGVPATGLHAITSCPTPRDGQRGRPGPGAHPDHVGYHMRGALASRVTTQQALVEPQRCVLLATNALDHTPLPPQELVAGDTGQGYAERGVRFRKDPGFRASSRYRKTPARIMARFMVMTVCLLVYAALA